MTKPISIVETLLALMRVTTASKYRHSSKFKTSNGMVCWHLIWGLLLYLVNMNWQFVGSFFGSCYKRMWPMELDKGCDLWSWNYSMSKSIMGVCETELSNSYDVTA